MLRSIVCLVTFASALGACAGSSVVSAGPQHVDARPIAAGTPAIPAGTHVAVVVDETVDSQNDAAGRRFSAHVTEALRAADGTVIVPAGAHVVAQLVSTGDPSAPRIRIDFESVETARGPAHLQAAVRHADVTRYPGPTQFAPVVAPPVYYDTYASYGYPYTMPGGAALGGGPWVGYEAWQPREVRLRTGAMLDLQLVRPLTLP